MIKVKQIDETSMGDCIMIWNQVVEEGAAFPQTGSLTYDEGKRFFGSQTYAGAAFDDETEETVGMYILHPNNIGRCGHICNASYAVKSGCRGRHIGEALVRDCMDKARIHGFRILQFNAVVASNNAALRLYKRLGFIQLGRIPGGFYNKKGEYEDIIVHYICLQDHKAGLLQQTAYSTYTK